MTIDVFRLRPVLALACCVVVVAVWAQGFARAQQGEATDAARFTGVSRALDTEGLRVSHRWFEAGAYTAWHRHTEGQLLFVEEGRARVQQRGGPMRELALAESASIGVGGRVRRTQQLVIMGVIEGDRTELKWLIQREGGKR